MEKMKSRHLKIALAAFSLYFAYFLFCLIGDLVFDRRQAQWAAVIAGFPLSGVLFDVLDPRVLDLVGAMGSTWRRVSEWAIILVSGLQYFALGWGLSWLQKDSAKLHRPRSHSR